MSEARETVHQFLPTFDARDAVGNHTVATQGALRQASHSGGIWAEHINPDLYARAAPYRGFARDRRRPGEPRRLLHYQASIGTEGLADFLVGRTDPLSIYYHNMTPAAYFDAYDAVVAGLLRRGREELKRMAPRVGVALAASRFNACELQELGMGDVRVMPPYLGPAFRAAPDREYLKRLEAGKRGIDLLFVGRVVPHKGHRHLVRVAAALRAADWEPRLFIAGPAGPRPYLRALGRQIDRLGLPSTVVLSGSLPEAQLAAHYQTADVYLCLSEHEGFGLPLLEAMRAGVPVVAYQAGAVEETLGGAGVLVRTLDPVVVAEVVARVHRDRRLRAELCEGQRRRAAEIEAAPRDEVLLGAIRDLARS